MEISTRVQGNRSFEILEQLRTGKTMLRMQLLGKDFQRLTIITTIQAKGRNPSFLVDYPNGFGKAISGIKDWKIQFEFRGKDQLLYRFTATGEEISGDEIRLRFPKTIERIQRREHFRLEVLTGTKLYFKATSTKHVMNVINISMGGVLGVLASAEKGTAKGSILDDGQQLRHIQMVFPSEGEDLRVHIKKALVIRGEEAGSTSKYRYALRFTDMEKDEDKKLISLIYRFQRQFLRRRQLMHD